jgi:hypothetical protein
MTEVMPNLYDSMVGDTKEAKTDEIKRESDEPHKKYS